MDEKEKCIKEYVNGIMEQREEISKAFIAKYGFEPDEVVQIHKTEGNHFRWWLEKNLEKQIDTFFENFVKDNQIYESDDSYKTLESFVDYVR